MRTCLYFVLALLVGFLNNPAYAGMTLDANHVYCNKLIIPDLSPDNFIILGSPGNYGKNSTDVYSCFGDFQHPILGADVKSFVELSGWYAKDDHQVFFTNVAIAGADPATIQVLEYPKDYGPLDLYYAKDLKQVFYQGGPITGADPATVRAMSGSISADKNHVYYIRSVIPEADPKSFTVLDQWYEKDANIAYLHGMPIQGSHPSTFFIVSSFLGWAIDIDHFYDVQIMRGGLKIIGPTFSPSDIK
jgi:hypothetical protein